jgi:hypothetical protein
MGLFVTPTEEKKIFIKGTPMELSSVYLRVEFASRADGKTMEIANYTYFDKAAYTEGTVLPTDLPSGSLTIQLEEGQMQDPLSAMGYMKLALEQQGYTVTEE